MKIKVTWLSFFLFYSPGLFAATFDEYIIENKSIDESSGLAASNSQENLLWTHNDSGNGPFIYALDFQGRNRGNFYLDEVSNRDWEDMAAFRWKGQDYLLIADSGDNFQMYLSSYIYIFHEPQLRQVTKNEDNGEARVPAWIIEYQYEDGMLYDVEAAAVDMHSQQIILLTKRTEQVHVFLLPLLVDEGNYMEQPIVTAKKIAQLDYIKNPTSMDISATTGKVAILSYGRVYIFDKKVQQTWADVLSEPDQIIKFRHLFQPEALCFAVHGQQLFISSEKLPAKLLRIKLKNN